MEVTEITAAKFQDMVRIGAHRLTKNAEFVNSLNVFPVPDGDTGTNMGLSFGSGAKAVNESNATNVGELAQSLAKGLLMGARGNSGVITSQLFRGFASSVAGKEALTAQDLTAALMSGVETAYKAVMKPVEGTILTVAREAARAANKQSKETTDAVVILQAVVAAAKKALAKTPDLLPVLKEVGVVDSGGQGLVFIYEGFLEGLSGEVVDDDTYQPDGSEMDEMVNAMHHQSVQSQIATEDITFGYCTEMMVGLGQDGATAKFDYEEFRNHLDGLGDSLLVVNDDEVVKVHVHTEHPGTVLAYGHEYGSMLKIKIDNMRLQHETILEQDQANEAEAQEPIDFGIIAIASGKGVGTLFKSLGATTILNGGQTMNPSTQDILDAIKSANAKQALILPNNGNIILAAQEAAKVADIPVAIVPSKTISQGMTSLLSFNPDNSLADNEAQMTAGLKDVISGQVTQSIRDTTIDGLAIKKDDYMGIIDGKIKVTASERQTATVDMIKVMLDDDSEIVTILIGEGGTRQEAQAIADAVMAIDDELEVELHDGGQPVYPYLVSVE
ncbi:DAK2 domain-containing protein [Loigolactobacillus coryniformis]|uniref:DAK2 domain-containing protein n=1 Tax=Loigolactobacillus coryniformis TaxID=1610 RepID=UPI002340BD9B|nr:DAK2 domain-containing protein [Loigolactobacillus coryniformis]MDC4184511.1 DAK2 domain-containing protein [Loigolactobacillus coryniformis]